MIRQLMQRGLMVGMLVLSLSPLAYAARGGRPAGSRGIVLTIVAIDSKADTATLQAEDGGQKFQMTTDASWKVGNKVECDLIDEGPPAKLQNCQPWGK